MSRVMIKPWKTALSNLQAAPPAGLDEGEIGIDTATGAFWRRPDGDPGGALEQIGFTGTTGTTGPTGATGHTGAVGQTGPMTGPTGASFSGDVTLTYGQAGYVYLDASGGDINVTLPLANSGPGLRYTFVRTDVSTHTVRVLTTGGDGIDPDGSSVVLPKGTTVLIGGGGTTWFDESTAFPRGLGAVNTSGPIGVGYRGRQVAVSGSSTTQTLPDPATVPGMSVGFLAVTAFTLALGGGGGFLGGAISGRTSVSMRAGDFVGLVSDGAHWLIFSGSGNMLGQGGTPVGGGMDYWGTTAPAGWLFPYGQEVSQASYPALYAVFGTMYGAGGIGTFTMPDKKGRGSIAKDDMGGAAAGRVTFGGSGVNGTTLGASGGDEHFQSHAHAASSTDGGHGHGVTDGGHGHGVTDGGHNHNIVDNGHVHGVNDPSHSHSLFDPTHTHQVPLWDIGGGSLSGNETAASNSGGGAGASTTDEAATGQTADGAFTGIAVDGNLSNLGPGNNSHTDNAATGVSVNSGGGGVSVNSGAASVSTTVAAAGTGAAGNLPPGIICNYIIFAGG